MSAAFSLEDPFEEVEVATPQRTVVFRLVEFVCPKCGDERSGAHVVIDDDIACVECCTCRRESDVAVLRVPTRARLAAWRDDAALHGTTALQCADGVHRCSFLAEASCRRLAPELTPFGKTRLLDEIARSIDGELTDAHRGVLAELGAALGLSAPVINGYLALR